MLVLLKNVLDVTFGGGIKPTNSYIWAFKKLSEKYPVCNEISFIGISQQ